MAETTPIQVGESALPNTLAATLRYVIVAALTFAVGRGWLDGENIEGIVGVLIALITAGYGLYRTWRTRKNLSITAEAAPNSVAVIK